MRLMVLGGSGFLGGYVLREALSRGHSVTALARSPAAARSVASTGAHPITGDLDHPGSLDEVFAAADCDALVCLASLGHGHGPAIVAAAEEAGIPRAVFTSTTAVTTTLHPPTKKVRLAAEDQIRRSSLAWTILRPTMIYGAAGDRNLSRLLLLISRTMVLPVPGSPDRLHQPVYVADVARAVLTALERPAATGSVYNVAGPEPISFCELLRTSASVVPGRTLLVPVPLAPVMLLARAYGALSRHPRISTEQLARLAEDKAFDIGDAVRDLAFAPRPFAEGISAEARMLGFSK